MRRPAGWITAAFIKIDRIDTSLFGPAHLSRNKGNYSSTFMTERANPDQAQETAVLVLADGTAFVGKSIGVAGTSVGEVVFNTAMTGYQEILTDPSYSSQIVTLTYPHIGNTGCNPIDTESEAVHAAGLVIRDLPLLSSSWRSSGSLESYLQDNSVVAIADIDTRRLTRHLRQHGSMPGAIVAGSAEDGEVARLKQQALDAAREFPGLAGMDLAQEVTCKTPYDWSYGTWVLQTDSYREPEPEQGHAERPLVVAMDFGVKHNILRMLHDRGCRVRVVPATATAAEILALSPAGVFLSNGPGDPEPCTYAIKTIAELLKHSLPTFGICLGHQLLALASGAQTEKMKFGHHGANHPVLDIASGRVMISSQNHGFAVNALTLGNHLSITHKSLFDGSVQGIERNDVPAFGFQGHPEASPGPHDVASLFDRFTAMLGASS